jgi:hypothetical protein
MHINKVPTSAAILRDLSTSSLILRSLLVLALLSCCRITGTIGSSGRSSSSSCKIMQEKNKQFFGSALVSMRIRIRIRIQHFLSMRIRIRIRIQIQGFDDLKLEKQLEKFFLKFAIYISRGLQKGRPCYRKVFIPKKRTSSISKLEFSSILWVVLALLDPDLYY